MPKIAASKTAIKAPRRPRRPRCAPVYRVRNWPAYEAGLKQRGSLTFWITPQALRGWYHQGPTQRGRQNTFSDLAIQTALMLRLVSALPLRQTEGFLTSILARGDDAGERHTAHAHPGHERAEQDAEGNGRRPHDELQHLKPDDFVDERGTPTAREQGDEQGEKFGLGVHIIVVLELYFS